MPAHKSPRPFVRCKNTHRKWPGCLVKFSQRSQSAREPSDFARPPSRGGNPVWEKAWLGRQPSCRYFPPLWRKAHSALGGAIIAPAPPAIGRYAIYIKNQDKSKPLLFNAASSGSVQFAAPPPKSQGKGTTANRFPAGIGGSHQGHFQSTQREHKPTPQCAWLR